MGEGGGVDSTFLVGRAAKEEHGLTSTQPLAHVYVEGGRRGCMGKVHGGGHSHKPQVRCQPQHSFMHS